MGEIPRPPEGQEEEKEEKTEQLPSLAIPEYIKINESPVSELAVAARKGDSNARLFFAQLQLIESYPEDDRRFLGTLKEVSRDMATSFDNLKKTPEEASENFVKLATVFNENAKGRFSVQVPRIGESVDRSYMTPIKQISRVKKINTWAVRNSKGIAEYKAEVE